MALLLGLARLLPRRLASDAGSALARAVGPLTHWQRRGLANLAHVYPDMTPSQHREIMSGVWDNLGRNLGEFAHLADVGANVHVSGLEHIPPDGTPTILVTAHMANWEVATWLSRLSGRPIVNIYRRPNNVYVDLLLKSRTHDLPIELIEKNNRAGIHLLRQLRGGGVISLFVDQKGTTGDVIVPFLGKIAQTVRTPAVLAAKTGATVIPARMVRKSRHELHMVIEAPLPPIAASGDTAERQYMERINDVISGWIADTPEQWLWIHRRWKNADAQAAEAARRVDANSEVTSST